MRLNKIDANMGRNALVMNDMGEHNILWMKYSGMKRIRENGVRDAETIKKFLLEKSLFHIYLFQSLDVDILLM